MEPPSVDKQSADKADKAFQFLIACLKHTKDGKTDWVKLVKEENIVTVNAAKKRWKRLMDAYGLSDGCLNVCMPRAKGGARVKGSAKAKGLPEKKRKFEEVEQEQEEEEEGEQGEKMGENGEKEEGQDIGQQIVVQQ